MAEALIVRRGGGKAELELVAHGYIYGSSVKITKAIESGRYLMVVHHACGNYNYTGYTDEGYMSALSFETDGVNGLTVESQYYGICQYYTSGGAAKQQYADDTTKSEITASMSAGTLTASWATNGGSIMHWYGSVYLLYKVG